jgi:hypothetical protein
MTKFQMGATVKMTRKNGYCGTVGKVTGIYRNAVEAYEVTPTNFMWWGESHGAKPGTGLCVYGEELEAV